MLYSHDYISDLWRKESRFRFPYKFHSYCLGHIKIWDSSIKHWLLHRCFPSCVKYPTCTCTSAAVYRICRISYMYIYYTEFGCWIHLFRNDDLECLFFSRDLKSLCHFTHASILLMYRASLSLSALVASCVFVYSLEPDQADNMNFVTLWNSGYVLKLLI